MIIIFILIFIVMFFIFTISLCFASAKEEEFYNKLIINKETETDEK